MVERISDLHLANLKAEAADVLRTMNHRNKKGKEISELKKEREERVTSLI